MIRKLGVIVSAAAVTACWGAPPDEQILAGLCTDLLTGDERILEDIAGEAGTDLDGFCSCYARTIVADPEKTALHKDAISAMVEARKAGDRGVEDAAKHVGSLIEAGEIDTFTERQLDSTGRDYQDISEEMGAEGGVCPV
jgi:hypothetical protein